MIVVILAGGYGTRLAEETDLRPKPMVEIGGRPILWHIMKHYSHHGFREFIIALGYKGDVIKRYFFEYHTLHSDLTVHVESGKVVLESHVQEPWTVHLVDTGLHTLTGGRLLRLRKRLGDERFLMTYGDGVSDVDLAGLVRFHQSHGRKATLTAARPPARYGTLALDKERVTVFSEKPQAGEGWVSAGYFVLEPCVLDYIEGDPTHLEGRPLERLAGEGELCAFRHEGFWQSMDTLRDKRWLEEAWSQGRAPWRVWAE